MYHHRRRNLAVKIGKPPFGEKARAKITLAEQINVLGRNATGDVHPPTSPECQGEVTRGGTQDGKKRYSSPPPRGHRYLPERHYPRFQDRDKSHQHLVFLQGNDKYS